MAPLLCVAITICLALGMTSNVRAEYAFTTLDVPDSIFTEAYGINNAGEIVGRYDDQSGRNFGFLLSGGVYTTIDMPGSGLTWAFGINDKSEIVGVHAGSGGFGFRGFLLSGGVFTSLEVPGATITEAFGINNAGEIVGFYRAGEKSYGFLLSGGVYTTIEVPGSNSSVATGINDAGVIVGHFMDETASKGFVLREGSFDTFDVSGADSTQALGLSNVGEIVGHYSVAMPVLHGFLLRAGQLSTIDVPGATSTTVFGTNDHGQIVGRYDGNGRHGFLATSEAISEPPQISIAVNPDRLWPPHGKMVPVIVSGAVRDGTVAVNASTVTYAVIDEYGRIQPSGTVAIGVNGSYTFTVSLEASRDGRDKDGRQYTIIVSAENNARLAPPQLWSRFPMILADIAHPTILYARRFSVRAET